MATRNLADESQPFGVRCECGERLTGIRQQAHQLAVCRECGATNFVLPADSYPALAPPKNRKQRKRKRAVSKVAIDIPESNFDESTVDIKEASPIEVEPEAKQALDVILPQRSQNSIVTPFRAIMLLAVVIVSLTAWWRIHVRSLDQAARVYQSERKAGDDALSRGEMAVAAEHFRLACDAVQTLGRTDAAAVQTCQLAKETEAAANLAVHPLLKIIERANKTLSVAKTEEERLAAEDDALALYSGQWVVMETNLYSVGGAVGEQTRRLLEYPFVIGETRIEIYADLPAFTQLSSQTGTQRVILAAQLDKCRVQGKTLVVEFVPESAFLWNNASTLKMIGLLSGDEEQDAATRALLSSQTRMKAPGR